MQMVLSIIPLGVGRGADGVFRDACSSSLLIMDDARPILLVDVGYGVVRRYSKISSEFTCPIYISHNHSDHTAELPIIGPVLRSRGIRLPLLAEAGVMERIRQHRLHELLATGIPLDDFFEFRPLEVGAVYQLTEDVGLEPIQGLHAERSFGFILCWRGAPILAASGDSGYSEDLYSKLSVADNLLLDGRESGNSEHAAFDRLDLWAAEHPGAKVWVTGYGETTYSPHHFSLCRPGEAIHLTLGTAPAGRR
jgi:hypothetical protein